MMGENERIVELEDFAVYCETVVLDTVGDQRGIWQDRAQWARDCAADWREVEEEIRVLRAAVERYQAHGPLFIDIPKRTP